MARIAIVYSVGDPAGSGSAMKLLELTDWSSVRCRRSRTCWYSSELDAYLAGFEEDVLYFDFLDDVLDVGAYIVLSRHMAKSGKSSLTVHTTGNPGPAEYGGRPRELAWSNPRLEKALLMTYKKMAEENGLVERYWIGLEATHHGPTSLSRPITFIEIGSTPIEWTDERAHWTMASTVLGVLSSSLPECTPVAGFGGTHYPERHTKLMLETDRCYGHILAKYALSDVDPDVIGQAMDRNRDGIRAVIVERKASRKEVRELITMEAVRRGLHIERI